MSDSPTKKSGVFSRLTARRWQCIGTITVLIVGVAVSALGLVAFRNAEFDHIRGEFTRGSEDHASAVFQVAKMDWVVMKLLRERLTGADDVTALRFAAFASPLLRDNASFRAIEWVPRVAPAPRDQTATSPRTQTSDGRYPIAFIYPPGVGDAELGLDLASAPASLAVIQRSGASGQATLSPPFRFPEKSGDRMVARLFLPAYSSDARIETAAERREHLTGFVVGIIDFEGVVEDGLAMLMPGGIDICLLDTTDPAHEQVLYFHRSRLDPARTRSWDDVERQSHLLFSKTHDVAGRQWTIRCAAVPAFIAKRATWYPWGIAAAGLLLTGLVVAYLIAIARHSDRAAHLAEQLTLNNRRLAWEVADRKKAEVTLWESKQRLQGIFDAVGTGILVVDLQSHTISDANGAAAEMIGLPIHGIVGRKCVDFFECPSEKGNCVFSGVRASVGHVEHTLIRSDGQRVPVLKTVTPITSRGRPQLLDCFINISAQKKAEEASQRENAKLSAMISGMEEGVVFADADNVIVEINGYLCRFLGQPREAIIGKCLEEFHHGAMLDRVLGQVSRFRTVIGSDPYVLQRPLGGVEVILRMQPIYRDGQYDGVLLNVIDVSELVKARHEAEVANQAKSRFLASMSHEIRTPMTAILGYADLLMDPVIAPDARANYVTVIRRSAEHLLALINDILDLSKIEAGKLSLEMRRSSIVSLLADVASVLRPRAEKNNVALLVEYSGPMPETILTDNARLRQAVVNLVGNAIKFTERGSVRIVATYLPAWRGEQHAVQIDVIDTGIGIRADVLPQLFQPFSQGDASISQKFGGTGLGLAISRQIAHLLGGDLTVVSTNGKGSTFTLTVPTGSLDGIPMLECPTEVIHDNAAKRWDSHGQDLAGVRILLAEDGFDNRRLIELILRKAGAVVESVENGRLAVERAMAGGFDVVLMDMNMPEMDGYEATRLLRDRGYARPILALTANAMSGDSELCKAAGCNEHLAKPIDRGLLINAVAAHAIANAAAPDAAAPSHHVELIVSQYADDPEMAAILGEFIDRLSGQIEAMREANAAGRHEDLRHAAHKLKGAGGSYGYPSLTEACHELEEAARVEDDEVAATSLELVAALVEGIQIGRNQSVSVEGSSA